MLADGYAVYTPGLSDRRGSASTFSHSDLLGSLRFLTDSGQNVTANLLPDAFGETVSQMGSPLMPFAWNGASGYQSDSDGLNLLGHRYYNSRTGRFITQDHAKSGDNWYAYADNSPANEVDPSGLTPMDGPGSSPVGSPGYADGAASGFGGSMEEFGMEWHQYFVAGLPYKSIDTPSAQNDWYHTYWVPNIDIGDWVDQNVTFGLVSASARDWDNHPGKAHWELAGAAGLVVATAFTAARAGVMGLAKSACFTAGTPVQEEKGAKPIQDIHTGELVATRNLETNQTEYRKVVRTFKHLAHDTITVEFADAKTGVVVDTVTATPEHPFYVLSQGMTALGSLGIGTLVVTRAGPAVMVHSLVRHTSAAGVAVYNLEVEGDHTYFVGNNGEWVHNDCTSIAKSLLRKAGEGSIIRVKNKIEGLLLEEGGWSYHDVFMGTDGKVLDPMRPQGNGLPFDDWVQSWQFNQEYDFSYLE